MINRPAGRRLALLQWRLSVLFAVLALTACATTSMQGSWSDPDYRGGPLRSIFVVGTAKDDLVRRLFEDTFSRELGAVGARGIASYRHLAADALEDRDAAQAKLAELGADAVLVSRVIGRRTDTVVTPARTTYRPLPDAYADKRRDRWHDDWRSGYEILQTPASVSSYEVVTVESNLYGRDGALLWTAQSETITGGDINALVDEFSKLLVDDLLKKGLL